MTDLHLLATVRGILDFFIQGGFFMLLLLILSFISVPVIIWRAMALRRAEVMPGVIEKEIDRLKPVDDAEAVVRLSRLLRQERSTLGKVANTALQHLTWPKSENVEAVQTKARHEIVKLENGLFILEIVVGIGPLLGLLGAVSGLVAVFAEFGESAVGGDPRVIAAGISEALSTTIVGIAVAIPSLIAYSYFSKKIENMAAEMESLVADLLAKCYFHKQRLESRGARLVLPSEEGEA